MNRVRIARELLVTARSVLADSAEFALYKLMSDGAVTMVGYDAIGKKVSQLGSIGAAVSSRAQEVARDLRAGYRAKVKVEDPKIMPGPRREPSVVVISEIKCAPADVESIGLYLRSHKHKESSSFFW